jgi:hypothetical protein
MKKILLTLLTLLLLSAFMFTMVGCKPVVDTPVDRPDEFSYKNYGLRYDDVSFSATPISASEVAGGGVDAALYILSVIDANLLAANYLASASVGGGSATSGLFELEGSLQFGDTYVRDNGAFYSQCVARVTSASSSAPFNVLNLAQVLLDQSDRKYSADGQTFYVQKAAGSGAECRMIEDYPYGTSNFASGEKETLTLEEYMDAEYTKYDYRELTHFVFTADTILSDSVTLTYNEGLYTLDFTVNLDGETIVADGKTARDIATEHARANMREAATSNDLEYGLFKVTIEVYDNGMIASYTKEESWEATLTLISGVLEPSGSSHSVTTVYYSWDPADCTFEGNNIDISWAS